nr:hypothetical protein [Tanacetum cinerariifolium]
KPPSLQKPAPSKTQALVASSQKAAQSSVLASNLMSPPADAFVVKPQSFQMIDYALWEVIENGATLPKTKVVKGVTTKMPITTAKEKAQRRL